MITTNVLGLELVVDPALQWGKDLLGYLADVQSPSADGPLHGSLVIQFAAVPHELSPADRDRALLDREYGVLIRFPDDDRIVISTAHGCPEWFSWAFQLSALRSRCTFVHAAGLEQNGTALLLAARSGFGKTALVADFVRRRGFRLLGDDLTLVSADGVCHAYPRALVVHPEHRSFLPELFTRGEGPVAPVALSGVIDRTSHALKPVLRRVPGLLDHVRHRHPRAVRVTPSSVFGAARIGVRGPLRDIVWLERRAGIDRPILRSAGRSMPARAFAGMIAELDAHCMRITNVAMTNRLLDVDQCYRAWVDVLRTGLRDARAYTLAVPASLPFTSMPAAVYDALAAEGVVEPAMVAS